MPDFYDNYDPYAVDTDPYAVGYDPFQTGVYNRPQTAQPQNYVVDTPPELVASNTPQLTQADAVRNELVSFPQYADARKGEDPSAIYDDYLKKVLPSYLDGAGLNDAQKASELAEFQTLVKRPAAKSLYDRATGAVDDFVSRVIPSNPDKAKYTDEKGLAAVQLEALKDKETVDKRRAELGTEKSNSVMQLWDGMASGLAGAFGSAAEFIGRNTQWSWLEGVGKDAKLEAAALMKEDPSFGNKLAGGLGSVMAFLPVTVAGGVAGGTAAAAFGAGRFGAWAATALGVAPGALLESSTVAQETYDNALKNTGNAQRAEEQAWKAFAANVPLSMIADKVAFFSKGASTVATLGKGIITQATEEGSQQILSNYLGYEAEVGKGTAENALIGGVLGGPIAVMTTPKAVSNTPLVDKAAQVIDKPVVDKTREAGMERVKELAAQAETVAEPVDSAQPTKEVTDETKQSTQRQEPVRDGQVTGQENENQGRVEERRNDGLQNVERQDADVQTQGQDQEVKPGDVIVATVDGVDYPTTAKSVFTTPEGQVLVETQGGAAVPLSDVKVAPATVAKAVKTPATVAKAVKTPATVAKAVKTPATEVPATAAQAVKTPATEVPVLPSEQKLPANLAGAKPNYSYGDYKFELGFASDVDKATYIVRNTKIKSKYDAAYLKWLSEGPLKGVPEQQVRERGNAVASVVKSAVLRHTQNTTSTKKIRLWIAPMPTTTKVTPTAAAQAVETPATEVPATVAKAVKTPVSKAVKPLSTKALTTTEIINSVNDIAPTQAVTPRFEDVLADTLSLAESLAVSQKVYDAIEHQQDPSSSTGAALSAFIEAELSNPTTGPIEGEAAPAGGKPVRRAKPDKPPATKQKRVLKPKSKGSVESVDTGNQAVQPSILGKSSGLTSDVNGSAAESTELTAEAGAVEVLTPTDPANIPNRRAVEVRVNLVNTVGLNSPEVRTLASESYSIVERMNDYGIAPEELSSEEQSTLRNFMAMSQETHERYDTNGRLKKQFQNALSKNDTLAAGLDMDLTLLTEDADGNYYAPSNIRDVLLTEPLKPAVVKALEGNDINAALLSLTGTGSNAMVRSIARALNRLSFKGVNVSIKAGNTASPGSWSSATRTLTLNQSTGLNEHVVIHELLHAATVNTINNPTTPEQKNAVAELNRIMGVAKSSLPASEYAFKNLEEFVAESLSNPAFQTKLNNLANQGLFQPKTTTLWQRLVNTLSKLLGVNTVLRDIQNITESLFMSSTQDNLNGVYNAPANPTVTPRQILVKPTSGLYNQVFDGRGSILNSFKQINKQAEKAGAPVPDSINVVQQEILGRSRSEKALRGYEEKAFKPLTVQIRSMLKGSKRTLAELQNDLVELHVIGRATEKIKELSDALYARDTARDMGITVATVVDPEYDQMLADRKQTSEEALAAAQKHIDALKTNSPSYFDELVKTAQLVQKANVYVQKESLAAKVISRDDYISLTTSSKSPYMPKGFYMPLQRNLDGSNKVALLEHAFGANYKADDPLSRVYAQAAITFNRIQHHTLLQNIAIVATQNEIIDEITKQPLFEIGPIKVLKRTKSGDIIGGEDNLKLDGNSIAFKYDGEYYSIKVNNENLLNNLRPQFEKYPNTTMAVVVGAARYFNQTMAIMRTGLNYGFAPFNFLRDVGANLIQLGPTVSRASYLAAIPGALGSAFYNTYAGEIGGRPLTKAYQAALDNGAFISQRTYLGLADTVRDVSQDLAPTLKGRMKAAAADPLSTSIGKVLLGWSQALETTNRLAVYNAGLAAGLSPAAAAVEAKTSTVNFERRSNFINSASPWFMFIGPRLQGIRTLYDKSTGVDANRRTQSALGSLAVIGLVASALGYANSGDDEDGINKYYKIAKAKRDTRIIVAEGVSGVPLPQEGSLFYVLGNAVGDTLFGPATSAESINRIVFAIMGQLSPFGVGQTEPTERNGSFPDYMARLFLPSVLQAPYDLATNKTTFGQSIVPTAEDSRRHIGKPARERYSAKENADSIATSKWLYDNTRSDVSPATITYLAKWMEGGAVSFWKDLVNPKEPSYPGQETNPLLRRVSSEAVPYGDANKFKDAADELKWEVSRPNSGVNSRALNKEFVDFIKGKDMRWRGYRDMSPEEIKETSEAERSGEKALMKRYYQLKGIVK